jgi:hypothetical protein
MPAYNGMQNYMRLYDYINEYWDLIYDIYPRQGNGYLTTYYNLDTPNLIWDNEKMMNGAYEWVGNNSGIRWNKYLLLPVYFPTEMKSQFDAQEQGYVNEDKDFTLTIPSDYGIIPYPGDIFKVESRFLFNNHADDIYPVYIVKGVQKQSPQDKTYWQLYCDVYQSKDMVQVDRQVTNVFVYFNYTSSIQTVSDATELTNMMNKNGKLIQYIKDGYDPNSGFYLI